MVQQSIESHFHDANGSDYSKDYILSEKDKTARFYHNPEYILMGSNGFLGKHLVNLLKKRNVKIISTSSKLNDLRNLNDFEKIFKTKKPDIVFNLAAKVGGILDNKLSPADFFYDNMSIIINTFYLCENYI